MTQNIRLSSTKSIFFKTASKLWRYQLLLTSINQQTACTSLRLSYPTMMSSTNLGSKSRGRPLSWTKLTNSWLQSYQRRNSSLTSIASILLNHSLISGLQFEKIKYSIGPTRTLRRTTSTFPLDRQPLGTKQIGHLLCIRKRDQEQFLPSIPKAHSSTRIPLVLRTKQTSFYLRHLRAITFASGRFSLRNLGKTSYLTPSFNNTEIKLTTLMVRLTSTTIPWRNR